MPIELRSFLFRKKGLLEDKYGMRNGICLEEERIREKITFCKQLDFKLLRERAIKH